MNIAKFGNFPQPMEAAPAPAPAAFPAPVAAPQPMLPQVAFKGAEHGDTVHFSGSCCK